MIKVENQKARSEDVDPDEYEWETLPGRCCFNQFADSCDTCTVWSGPENFCHTSRENCELCGGCPIAAAALALAFRTAPQQPCEYATLLPTRSVKYA
jgi:hypothetical protein